MAGTTTTFPGAPGPQGPQGDPGPPGPPGDPQTPYASTPANIGTANAGSSDDYARGDHVHAAALADLSDVASTAPSSGEVLTWSGSEWAPAAASGGIAGTIAADEIAFGTGVDSIGGSANLTYNVGTGTLAIIGDASDCLTVTNLDGQFLAVNPVSTELSIADPLNASDVVVLSPSSIAAGNGSQSGNVSAGQVSVTDNGTTNRLALTVPAGLATLTSADSGDVPQTLALVLEELRVNGDAGAAGQVLTSGGAGVAPTWETPSGGGGTVVGLTDRYEELPSQTFSDFAHGGLVAASPTRDIQTAIDATPAGPACQVIVGPGSYAGATVTIPAGRNNISIIGPQAGDFGGTIASLSSSRALTVGNNVVRARIVNLQIEGLTTISTTGAGVHRIERCQLEGGLTIGAISATIYVVGCTLGNVSVNAGFTGTILIDRCAWNSGATFTNNTQNYLKVLISDSAGLATAPTLAVSTNAALLNGRFQTSTGTVVYRDGNAISGAPVTALSGLTPAADRIAYYTSGLTAANTATAAMTALTPFGRSLIDDADASAARTTLGLGTAATSAATAFQAADATLTALAGVTTAANKLPYFTGVDTAAVADITTAGREILSTASSGTNGQVLTSSGGGAPTWTTVSGSGSGYAADSWDDSFSDPNGAVPTGWTAETSPVITYPVVGSGTAIQLASTTNPARLTATYAGFAANTVWEARVEMRASQVGTANESAFVIRDGTKRISLYPSTSGLVLEAGLMELLMPHAVNDWCIWTIRRSGTRVYFWSGPRMLYAYSYASLTADVTLAGSVRLGTSTSATRTTQIRGWWVKFGSVNDAPPDYTFRTTYFGRP